MTQSHEPVASGELPREQTRAPVLPRPCVMVVDDDAAVRAMLQTALEKDYSVVCLSNGDRVLDTIDRCAPSLLMLDINMPGSDGYEVCRKVRIHARLKKLPVLFMTIRNDDATFLRTLESGGDAVICKPFEMPALRGRIRALLAGRA